MEQTVTSTTILTLLGVILGGAGFWEFVKYIVGLVNERIRKKKGKKTEFEEFKDEVRANFKAFNDRMDAMEAKSDAADLRHDQADDRQQMLFLMEHSPNDAQALLLLAEHYFVTLKGDWYMTSKFKKHCAKYDIPLPEWFHDHT